NDVTEIMGNQNLYAVGNAGDADHQALENEFFTPMDNAFNELCLQIEAANGVVDEATELRFIKHCMLNRFRSPAMLNQIDNHLVQVVADRVADTDSIDFSDIVDVIGEVWVERLLDGGGR